MVTLFMVCSVVGGTVLLFQLVLTLLGFMHVASDFGDHTTFDGVEVHDGPINHADHGPGAWLWGMVSFRTVTAAMTFFGLFGLAMRSSGASLSLQITTALVAGLAAMYSVHYLMRALQRLAQDNTIQLKRAIGKEGTVYLSVPANNSGTGKVHMTVQGRLEEFEATTPSRDKLPVGARVVVIGIAPTEILVIEPVDAGVQPASKLAQLT